MHDGCMESVPSIFRESLAAALARLKIPILPAQLAGMEAHFGAMIDANRTMNLTRITDPVEAAIKHYADSLALLPWAATVGLGEVTLLDIGTGAGFPAVPLAVMRPDWSITAIDGTRKKADFVARVAAEIGLGNLRVEHGHSDHWRSARRFNVVTTRAVAPLGSCIRSARPYLTAGGRLVAYKTAEADSGELADAEQAARRCRMKLECPYDYELELAAERLRRTLRIAAAVD